VLAVTDKQTTGAPHFVETGHCQPTRQPAQARRAIEGAAVRGVRALGIDWAAAHAEVKLSPAGPFLMEIGARLGGDFITTELVPRSTGVDMVEGAINLALGHVPDLAPRHEPRAAAIRYCRHRPGRVSAIEGVDKARGMPGVKIVEVYFHVGQVVGEVTSSLARAGHVIVEGPSADQAVANAEAARDAIVIRTEPA
jgi:biotin carboxylase